MDMDQKGPGKNKGMWTEEDDRELVYALFDMVNTGNHKADNDFKSGLLGVLEGVLHEKLSGCGIKAKPHIESRVKTLKRDIGTVFDMVNGVGCNGFGWDSNTNMVVAEKQVWDVYVQSHKHAAHWKNRSFPHCDMLCIIFEKDRAMGKDAVTADDVLEEVSRNESIDTQNLSVGEIDTLSNASINDEGNSNKGNERKNSRESSDAFREAAIIIGTKIEEATNKFSRALGVDLDIALKRDKINEELRRLSNL
ncbi:hypothetical protein CsSME_00050464 [Camellia sinensis var. sinensis]